MFLPKRVRKVRLIKGIDYEEALKPNMAVFVPGNEQHQWVNTGNEPFGFICVVPKGAESESKPQGSKNVSGFF